MHMNKERLLEMLQSEDRQDHKMAVEIIDTHHSEWKKEMELKFKQILIEVILQYPKHQLCIEKQSLDMRIIYYYYYQSKWCIGNIMEGENE